HFDFCGSGRQTGFDWGWSSEVCSAVLVVHPMLYGWNTDYHGPHDGHHMASLALEARTTGRIGPCSKNPWLGQCQWGRRPSMDEEIGRASCRERGHHRRGTEA